MSQLKYFYTCKNKKCNLEWVELGVNYIYCKYSEKYIGPENSCYPEYPNQKEVLYYCDVASHECRENKNPITSFSYCDICYDSPPEEMIQGFLYSEFYCEDCEYGESIDGLQEFSHELCDCGHRLVNYDYKKEYYLLTLENEEKSVLSEIKKKYGTTLKNIKEYFRKYFGKYRCVTENCEAEWRSAHSYAVYDSHSTCQKCFFCKIKYQPYNLQLKYIPIGGGRFGKNKKHKTDGCGMCKRLGRNCAKDKTTEKLQTKKKKQNIPRTRKIKLLANPIRKIEVVAN